MTPRNTISVAVSDPQVVYVGPGLLLGYIEDGPQTPSTEFIWINDTDNLSIKGPNLLKVDWGFSPSMAKIPLYQFWRDEYNPILPPAGQQPVRFKTRLSVLSLPPSVSITLWYVEAIPGPAKKEKSNALI